MPERAATGPDRIDLLVIGGGITGCAVARDAAARGLRVHLVERRDLAAGTSGRSTKLLHGGLRYLEHGHLGLVRESLREREITARLAPGLASPLRLILPVWPGSSPGRLVARFGVALYGWLAGANALPRGGPVDRKEIAVAAPDLRPGYTGGVAFYDRQTDDARLTVAIARDAVRRGAAIALGMEVVALGGTAGAFLATCRDESGVASTIASRCIVNATGAWTDRVRGLRGAAAPMLGTSRGAHLVLRRLELRTALLLSGREPEHRMFAIPWRGVVLFGTTDAPNDADPGRDEASADDLRLLFGEARRAFPSAELTRADVLSTFSAVRPLLRHAGKTLSASREHVVRDEDGLITITGGKLTTWRTMAIDAVNAAARRLGVQAESPSALLVEPLPGGSIVTPELEAVLADEMPRHAEDVLFRRLPVGHDPSQVTRLLPEVVTRMTVRGGWGPARAQDERDRVLTRLEAQSRRIDEALGTATGG